MSKTVYTSSRYVNREAPGTASYVAYRGASGQTGGGGSEIDMSFLNDYYTITDLITPLDDDIIHWDAVGNLPAIIQDLEDISAYTLNDLIQYDGTNWVERTPSEVALTINLEDIGDTNFTSLATNHVVRWDAGASEWSNISPSNLAGQFNLTSIGDMNFSGLTQDQVIRYSAGDVWENVDFILDNLTNVTITSAANNDFLKYNGTAWVDVTADQLANELDLLQIGRVSANLVDPSGYVLVWDNYAQSFVSEELTASHVTSGTFDDARISESSVTQHDAALSITKSQMSDFDVDIADINATGTPSSSTFLRGDGTWQTVAGGVTDLDGLSDVTITSLSDSEVLMSSSGTFINRTLAEAGIAAASHTHATSAITSGTFDNARISESSVTQHEAALSLTKSQISDFDVDIADINATGTPSSSTYLRGDGTWATLAGGVTDIDDLSDVTITSLTDSEVLMSSSGVFINRTLAEAGIAAASHTHTTSDITNLSSYTGLDSRYYTESEVDALTWDASDIVSGTFADGRIAQSNVTQHQAALSITTSQISNLSSYTGLDARYYTETELSTSGSASVHWGNLTNIDVDIADIDATGTPSSSTYLRGDGTWTSPPVGVSFGSYQYLIPFMNSGTTDFDYSSDFAYTNGKLEIGSFSGGNGQLYLRSAGGGQLILKSDSPVDSLTSPHHLLSFIVQTEGGPNVSTFSIGRDDNLSGISNAAFNFEVDDIGTENITIPFMRLDDSPTTSGTKVRKTWTMEVDGTERAYMYPRVADGASAVAYMFDTETNLTTAGAKIVSFKNNGTEVFSIDKDGGASLGGDLGIGIAPFAPLSVKGGTDEWVARFGELTDGNRVGINHTGGYGIFVAVDNTDSGKYALSINNSGGNILNLSNDGNLSLDQSITASGGFIGDVQDKTSNYTLTNTDDTITNNGATASITINLPASPTEGKEWEICNVVAPAAGYSINIRKASGTVYLIKGGTRTSVTSASGYALSGYESMRIKYVGNSNYLLIGD